MEEIDDFVERIANIETMIEVGDIVTVTRLMDSDGNDMVTDSDDYIIES